MRSLDHEGIVAFFLNRPPLAVELVREAGREELVPAHTELAMVSQDLTQAHPAEAHADALAVLRDGERARLAIVIEVQLRRDKGKRFSWPLYEAAARQRHQCTALVLVVAPDPSVARWAAQPISMGNGGSCRPLVVGPHNVPAITDRAKAHAAPELAVLSAMMHAKGELGRAVQLALTAMEAVHDEVPEPVARVYLDFMERGFGAALRRAVEEQMAQPGFEWRSEFALKHRGEGRKEGLEEGREEGRREVLTELLSAKFGDLPDWATGRLAEASTESLHDWTRRVLTAGSLEQVFEA